MWLLKLHLAISILCLLTFVGFREVFKERIIANGYKSKKKKGILKYWIFFIPILNFLCDIMLFVMISMKHEDFYEWCENHKNKENSNGETANE